MFDESNKENINPNEIPLGDVSSKRIKTFTETMNQIKKPKYKVYRDQISKIEGRLGEALDFKDETYDRFSF